MESIVKTIQSSKCFENLVVSEGEMNRIVESNFKNIQFDTYRFDVQSLCTFLASGRLFRVKIYFYMDSKFASCESVLVKKSKYANLEFESLIGIRKVLKNKFMLSTIPKVVGYDASSNTIITNYFDSHKNLQTELIKFVLTSFWLRSFFVSVYQSIYNVGRWLADFQNESNFIMQSLNVEVDDIEKRLDGIDVLSKNEKKIVVSKYNYYSLKAGTVPYYLSHGDFAPRNILIKNGNVKVIDWEMVPENKKPCMYDLLYFKIIIEKMACCFFWFESMANRLGDRLEKGYFGNNHDFSNANYQATRILVLVVLLSRQINESKRRPLFSVLSRKKKFINYLASELKKGI